jgi:hypothetical protein
VRRLFSIVPLWITPRAMSWAVLAFFSGMLLSVLLAEKPWPWRSAVFPVMVAATCILLAVVEAAVANIPALRRRYAPSAVLDLGLTTDLSDGEVKWRSNAAIAWMLFLFAGVVVVGFHVIVPVFILVYLRWVAQANWSACLTYAAITWVVIFVFFDRMMEVRWPSPLIGL